MSVFKSSFKQEIMEMSTYGRTPRQRISCYEELNETAGVYRQEGTIGNKLLRDYALAKMRELGLAIKVDKVGNIFGRKEGSQPSSRTIMTGSHLDSVANGGALDGALGVFAAIEALRRLGEGGYVNKRSVEVVAFTGEEGSTFGRTLLGSSVLVGSIPATEALALTSVDGVTLDQTLRDSGYRGNEDRGIEDVEYFVELHIEQGPILHNSKVDLGIVENISGIAWLTVDIRGEENHAGTTPMSSRVDALVAAADIIHFVRDCAVSMAESMGPSTVATVGELHISPNQKNVIPGNVQIGIDIRDVEQKNIDHLLHKIQSYFVEVESRSGVEIRLAGVSQYSPIGLSPEVCSIIDGVCLKEVVSSIKLNSGAVHDAQNMAKHVKTGMIFVPSFRGVSHSPMEWTNWDSIECGVTILTEALMALDQFGG